VLLRALFPAWLWKCRSTRLDMGFFLLNVFVTGTLVGWSLLSYSAISHASGDFARAVFGRSPFPVPPPLMRGAMLTVALFLAYDFAYWADHYIKHKVPFLWEFHRVHHTAEVLSPLTAFRMHPVDSLIFYNIAALIIGVVNGLVLFLLGEPAYEATLGGTNIILVVFVFAVIHLQHSHIDIRLTGPLGRILFSPAHHHIHHSSDPAHYDSNLGSCLAVWDWMFGTLILPEPHQRPWKYGAEAANAHENPHGAWDSLITPFVRSARVVYGSFFSSLPRLSRQKRIQPGE
ncbi:MAG: sterol desaturase family protein, partial [Asticcacaulis sp.]